VFSETLSKFCNLKMKFSGSNLDQNFRKVAETELTTSTP
jgi:hypothetical protein